MRRIYQNLVMILSVNWFKVDVPQMSFTTMFATRSIIIYFILFVLVVYIYILICNTGMSRRRLIFYIVLVIFVSSLF